MQQAEAQAAGRNVRVEDGWVYFVHGWTQVISKVLNVPIDPTTLRRLFDVAEGIR